MQRKHWQKTSSRGLLALLASLGPSACSEDTPVATTVVHPTLVSVSPVDFLGQVPCVDAPGGMQSYVATIFDVDARLDPGVDTSPPFPVPSSGPTPCTQSVGFSRVIPFHRYTAEIKGYDRAGLQQLLPSVDVLFDPATGERVAPRWSTVCDLALNPSPDVGFAGAGGSAGLASIAGASGAGGAAGASGAGGAMVQPPGVTALPSTVRTIRGCRPLTDASPSDLRSVSVNLDGALGALACGDSADTIARFEVQTPSGDLLEAACGETVTLEDVLSSGTLVLPVLAYAAGESEPEWGTTCLGTPATGVAVTASCQPLTNEGALTVSPTDALDQLGLACDGIRELTLSRLEPSVDDPDTDVVVGTPQRLGRAECVRSVSFGGIASGTTAKVLIEGTAADGTPLNGVVCDARVIPSQSVLAACTLAP